MGIEDLETGKITPIDLCRECLWEGYQYRPKVDVELEMRKFYEGFGFQKRDGEQSA